MESFKRVGRGDEGNENKSKIMMTTQICTNYMQNIKKYLKTMIVIPTKKLCHINISSKHKLPRDISSFHRETQPTFFI